MKQQYETIAFKIIKRIGVLSEYQNGWKKEINLVSWNGNEQSMILETGSQVMNT